MEKPPYTVKLPQLFARWRTRNPWPMPSNLQQSLTVQPPPAVQEARAAEQAAIRQRWETEGGTVKPPLVDGPKLPL